MFMAKQHRTGMVSRNITFELTGTAQFAVSELSDLLAEVLIMTWWDEFMEIPMPERRCKRHKWKDGWICDKCGLRRADYERDRSEDRAKYWLVEFGNRQKRKFAYLQDARNYGFHFWHEGDAKFKEYKIVRVSNLSRKVVYHQYGELLK